MRSMRSPVREPPSTLAAAKADAEAFDRTEAASSRRDGSLTQDCRRPQRHEDMQDTESHAVVAMLLLSRMI